jgi:DNA repair exonuclease SbcCD nuclease subunit
MIYITGDTHGVNLYEDRLFKDIEFTSKDKLIILGDFGFLFDEDIEIELIRINELQKKLKCEILFIDGNHENFTKLNAMSTEEKYGGVVGKIIPNVYHLKRGEKYIINDKKFLVMGGAASVDKHLRIEGISWWKEEIPNRTEIDHLLDTMEECNEYDYILTHTCPESIFNIMFSNYHNNEDYTRKILDFILKEVIFKKWYFGHFHTNETYQNFICMYTEIIKL